MKARARVVAAGDGAGGTRLTTLRSEAPLVLRDTPGGLYLVGGAGGPLGGDDLAIEIEVGAGARLTIRTAAASIVLPGRPGDGPSNLHVDARVAAGGELRWLPGPVVAVQGCVHHVEMVVALEEGAALMWREEVVLGRHGEPPGSVRSRATVDVGGRPLLRHELALGPGHPGAASPAVTAGARAVGSVLLAGPEWATGAGSTVVGDRAVVLPLAGPGWQVLALADDAPALRRQLIAGIEAAARHTAGRAAP